YFSSTLIDSYAIDWLHKAGRPKRGVGGRPGSHPHGAGSSGGRQVGSVPLARGRRRSSHGGSEVAWPPNRIYGVANLESLSVKRQRVLPTPCCVYDLSNFAS